MNLHILKFPPTFRYLVPPSFKRSLQHRLKFRDHISQILGDIKCKAESSSCED